MSSLPVCFDAALLPPFAPSEPDAEGIITLWPSKRKAFPFKEPSKSFFSSPP